MQKTAIRDFTHGSIPRQLMIFAWPLLLSNLLQVVYNMVDMIVVGNVLGQAGISAVAIGGDISNLLTFVAMGFSSAGQVLIARLIGSRRTEDLSRFVGTMMGFLLTCSFVMSAAALIFQGDILRLMSTPKESYQGAMDYSRICIIGLPFIYGYNMVSAVMRGMGDSKHPFVFISIAAVMNLILDVVFVVGLGLGPGSAALATVISQATSFIACVVFLMRNKDRFSLNLKFSSFIHWDKQMLLSLVRLGLPMAIKSAAIHTSRMFVNSWINSYGVAVSAFAGIASKLASIANLVSNALNTAGSTIVGQNTAAGEYGRVRKTMGAIAVITFTASAIASLIVVLFTDAVFGLFTTEEAVLALAPGYLPSAVLLFLGSAARCVMNALINGSGNYRINFATAILDGFVMRIGLSLLFGLAMDMRHYGFWLGDALAGFTPFFIGLAFYFSGRWKTQEAKA